MSSRYTADGKRKSSMTHARRSWTCDCGRKVWGNGGKSSHQRACTVWAEAELARLDGMLSRTGDREITGDFRYRVAVKRDELRARLGDPNPYRA
jgi:hypothetical protein